MRRLSNRFQWIEYKGNEILSIDFSNLYAENFTNAIKKLRSLVENTEKENIYALLDTSGSYINAEVFKELRKTAEGVNKKIKKTAITGSTNIQQIFIKILRKLTHIDFELFDDEEDAKEWLIDE